MIAMDMSNLVLQMVCSIPSLERQIHLFLLVQKLDRRLCFRFLGLTETKTGAQWYVSLLFQKSDRSLTDLNCP